MLPYNKKLKPLSRALRSSMTDAESLLWGKLRKKQINNLQFYRQKPLGQFIVDFYCPSAQLVIEIDGGQHYTDDGMKNDAARDNALSDMELRVLRFSNIDVLTNMDGVIAEIVRQLQNELEKRKTKSPLPPFSKGVIPCPSRR